MNRLRSAVTLPVSLADMLVETTTVGHRQRLGAWCLLRVSDTKRVGCPNA
jgi:hypothetical protein